MMGSKRTNFLDQVPQDVYDRLNANYEIFKRDLDKPSTQPAKIFSPLPKESLDDLELIRAVSQELQLKKDEDIKKQQQAASLAEEEAKKAAEQAAEEAAKTEKEETEKTE